MSSPVLLIDDALGLLSPKEPYDGPAFSNIAGRQGDSVTALASFTFPAEWDKPRRSAVCGIINSAVSELAKQDRLYSDELGPARIEQDWDSDRHCHYITAPGAIAPGLDDVKQYIDTTLRHEFANPAHWVKKNPPRGRCYFVAGSKTPPDFGSMVRQAVYHLGTRPPLNTHAHMMVMNETPGGGFVDFFKRPTILGLRKSTNPDDGSKLTALGPAAHSPRQGIEISEPLAREIMPLLGVDIRQIQNETPRAGRG